MAATLHTTTEIDGTVILEMDIPGKSVNTWTSQLLTDLVEAVATLERQTSPGLIIASTKPTCFNVGGDLFEMREMSPDQVRAYLAAGQALFERIARLPMPTVAAIGGDCLGGGFELALACRYRIAADDFKISIGLPEVKIGLIPAWGGSTRLPRLIGITKALPILLAGKVMPPRRALRAGIIDEVVRPEALLAAARRIIRDQKPPRRPPLFDRMAANISLVRRSIIKRAGREVQHQTHGNYPAPERLVKVVEAGYERGFAAGLEAERDGILDVSQSEPGRNLMRLFFLRQQAKRQALSQLPAPRDLKYAAVIGGGTMGSGIVHALILAGMPVRLVEVDPSAVSAALRRINALLDGDVSAGRIDKLAARHAFNRISPTTEWAGLDVADVVIEAVVESLSAKREIFSRLDRITRPTAVLATNTSSLLVSEIAEVTLHPERVVGLHFFNPVSKMPLVEVVRGRHSDDQSMATAVSLSSRIGKIPLVLNDSPGFLVNRILIPYLVEALLMASEGASISIIDTSMKNWGMPMGPFELLDEIGLDVAAHVLDSLKGAATDAEVSRAVAAITQAAIQRGFLGKKSDAGFYVYPSQKRRSRRKPVVNEALISGFAVHEARSLPEPTSDEIQTRLVLPIINEAVHLLDEHVTDSTDVIDLATVIGFGFAPFRGGLIHYANSIGSAELARQLGELSSKYGSRFVPAPLLVNLGTARQPLGETAESSSPTQLRSNVERVVFH